MLFQLPEDLRQAVAIYDPALKPLIKAQLAAEKLSKPRKPSNHLGLPVGFIPEDILSAKSQEEIFTDFNQSVAADRYRIVEDSKRAVLIYHHQKVWHAYWFLKDKQSLLDQPYIYGFAIAYKAAPSTASKVGVIDNGGHVIGRGFNDDVKIQKFNKTEFCHRCELITLDMIRNDLDGTPWQLNLNQGKDAWHKREKSRMFSLLIRSYLPNWGPTGGVFERISHSGKSVLGFAADRLYSMGFINGDMTVEQLSDHFTYCLPTDEYKDKFSAILEKPFFRKDMHAVTQQCNAAYHDYSLTEVKHVKGPYRALMRKVEGLDAFTRIYPDATLDHMQRIYTACQYVNEFGTSTVVGKWISQNVPVGSFVGWIENFVADRKKQWEDNVLKMNYTYEEDTMPAVTFNLLVDTFNMLRDIYEAQSKVRQDLDVIDFTYTRRWRLVELHDTLMGERWKYRTTNEKLPQDLLPEPIKVEHNDTQWTFFQPRDLHQLGDWGRAVRNCVGSASSYAKGIKAQKHFIVLAMLDNRPEFTIQLNVMNGSMHVNQIAGVSSAKLTEEQRDSYQEAFAQVLAIRNSQLKPAA